MTPGTSETSSKKIESLFEALEDWGKAPNKHSEIEVYAQIEEYNNRVKRES